MVEGLVPALRAAMPAGSELVVAEPHAAARSGLRRIGATRGGLARLRHEQVALARLARQADTVHLCDSRALLASRTPFVLTVHDVSFLDHPEWFSPTAARYKATMLTLALAKKPRAVICDSRYTMGRLLVHHPRHEHRVRVVHPGVAAPPPVAGEPHPEAGAYFVTIGAIEPRKNHLTLLRAFTAARRQGFDLRWKVAGAPGHRAEPILRELRAAGGVDVLGWLPRPELEKLLRGACFAATPSLLEGFGYPPLEAMARAIAVICATGTALDETAGDAALRVPALDVSGWVHGLEQMADVRVRTSRAQKGPVQAARFDWATTANSLLRSHL